MPAPVNYSTTVAVERTISAIQKLLVAHRANRVSVDYRDTRASAIHFALSTPHGTRNFSIQARVERMRAVLCREDAAGNLKSGSKARRTSEAQAERVAWRVLLTWLEAQFALVDADIIDVVGAPMPFLCVDENGRTLHEAYVAHESAIRAIAPPE